MPRFDWRESAAETEEHDWGPETWQILAARYAKAGDAIEIGGWIAFITRIQNLMSQPQQLEFDAELRSSLDIFVSQLRSKPPIKQPTVFVSHQRHDAAWAEWAAWAATEAHFDYWLDIHDPSLITANASILPAAVKSILIAGIIEVALTNSTHIVSMQTKNAQSSRWVPYEFGRAKERRLLARNTVSWFEKGVTPATNGDYLGLASCAFFSADLRTWMNKAGRIPPPNPNERWKKPPPGRLPN
jgi:hypothetical protein